MKNPRRVLLSSIEPGRAQLVWGASRSHPPVKCLFGWKASLTQQHYLLGLVLAVAVMQAPARLPDNALKSRRGPPFALQPDASLINTLHMMGGKDFTG